MKASSSMTLTKLKEMAKQKGVSGYSKYNSDTKNNLVQRLNRTHTKRSKSPKKRSKVACKTGKIAKGKGGRCIKDTFDNRSTWAEIRERAFNELKEVEELIQKDVWNEGEETKEETMRIYNMYKHVMAKAKNKEQYLSMVKYRESLGTLRCRNPNFELLPAGKAHARCKDPELLSSNETKELHVLAEKHGIPKHKSMTRAQLLRALKYIE